MTDLTIMNGGEEDVTVEVAWLARNRNNIDAEGEMIDIAAGETVVFEDVIMSLFGEETATGSIHIEVVEEKDDEEGDEEDEDFITVSFEHQDAEALMMSDRLMQVSMSLLKL